jgi:LmbE family N-acetylglucosaminyl deacetylase
MIMLDVFRTVLVLAPHTDDGEFGAGGTLARLTRAGAQLHYVAFSACEDSVPPDFPTDVLRHEVIEATGRLGIARENVAVLHYQVRRFNERRQDILDDIVGLRRAIVPDLVLMPSLNDVHQDHRVIAEEGRRGFKGTTVLSYELPWNNFGTNTTCYIALDESALTKKIDAISAYESQAHREYAQPEVIVAWARSRGLESGHRYAEAMEVVRWYIP